MKKLLLALALVAASVSNARAQGTQVPSTHGTRYLCLSATPFSVGQGGLWRKCSDGLMYFTKVDGSNLALGAGTGDMVLAGTQTNTGVKTFNDGTFRQLNSGGTFYSQLASAATGNRTATIPDATGTLAMLGLAQQFTADQGSQSFTLTDAANISTTWSGTSKGNTATVTLAGNRTLDNPTGMLDGHTYQWVVKQDATGSRTLAYGTKFAWPAGTAPTLTTTAAAYDVISCVYLSGPDLFFCNAMNDVKH
jgi:hypothetical protein